MIARGLMFGAALGLVACTGSGAARSFDDPAVQKLFGLSTPMYVASTTIAGQIAQNCARYRYDAALDAELNEARNEVGRGSLSAIPQRNAIDLELDVARRSFQAKHGVDLTSDDLCAAADAETLEGTGISAMLVPA